MRGVAQIHEQPMRVVGGRLAERLIGDGNHTLSVFARRFGQQLLRPGAERADRWRGDDGELVVPGNGKNADCQAERDDAVIFRGRYLGTAAPRRRAGRFEKEARIVTRGRKRHHAEMREHGIASADIGDAAEDATEAFRLGRFLQLRSGIGDGNKLARGRGAEGRRRLGQKIVHQHVLFERRSRLARHDKERARGVDVALDAPTCCGSVESSMCHLG